jgi:hypothetical protein
MEIQTIGQSYTVIINGQKVTEFTGSRTTDGHIDYKHTTTSQKSHFVTL